MKNVPFKRFLINRNGGMWGSEPGSDEFDVLCIRVADFDYENLKTKASASTVRSITEKQLQKNQLHDGDILLEKSGGGEKTPVGRAVYYSGNDDAICSNFIERLTVNQQTLNPKFACYILSAAYSQRKNLDCIKQTTGIQNLSVDDYLSSVTVPLFDIKTQKRITKWLDKQLSKVAQVITAKQAQLQKLSSYRQSLITRAVTKGLDPNVEMKDSGVEWIGNIPKNWLIPTLSHVCRSMRNGYVGPTDGLFVPDGIKYVQSLHVKNGEIDFSVKEYYVREEWAKTHPKLRKGNLVIVQTGDIGQVGVVRQNLHNSNCHALIICDIKDDICNVDFLSFYFQSKPGKELLLLTKTGLGLPHLNTGKVCYCKVPLPPLEEQKRISIYCSNIERQICKAEKTIRETILKLKEYRSSLISAAVTGQLAIEEAAE